jgi:hypothetical protein
MTERRRPRSIARVGSASGDATPTKDHQPHGDHQEIEQERRQGRGAGGGVVPAVFGAKETATAPVAPSFESTCSLPAADFAMKPECTLTWPNVTTYGPLPDERRCANAYVPLLSLRPAAVAGGGHGYRVAEVVGTGQRDRDARQRRLRCWLLRQGRIRWARTRRYLRERRTRQPRQRSGDNAGRNHQPRGQRQADVPQLRPPTCRPVPARPPRAVVQQQQWTSEQTRSPPVNAQQT